MGTARLRRPQTLALVAAVGIPILVIVVLTVRWFLNPPSVDPDRADAVVVLAGGSGERLDHALQLMERSVADTLVVSVGNEVWNDSARVAEICGEDPPFELVCFQPDPDTTKGEAQTFAELAEEAGWQRVALVTSEYHLHRATLRFNRCFSGEVLPVAAPAGIGVGNLTHEWLGTIEAQILDRGCD
ncbi:MAG: YdcF family protein [Actinomycetota bacterium]